MPVSSFSPLFLLLPFLCWPKKKFVFKNDFFFVIGVLNSYNISLFPDIIFNCFSIFHPLYWMQLSCNINKSSELRKYQNGNGSDRIEKSCFLLTMKSLPNQQSFVKVQCDLFFICKRAYFCIYLVHFWKKLQKRKQEKNFRFIYST